jgi:hypothetical protein
MAEPIRVLAAVTLKPALEVIANDFHGGSLVLGCVRITELDAFLDLLAGGWSGYHFFGRSVQKIMLARQDQAEGEGRITLLAWPSGHAQTHPPRLALGCLARRVRPFGERCSESFDVSGARCMCGRLNLAIMLDYCAPEIGQGGATTMQAAGLRCDDRHAKAVVQIVDEEPGASIGHPHLTTGLRNRAVLVDQLQQSDFAGTNGAVFVKIDAQCEPGHGVALRQLAGGNLLAETAAILSYAVLTQTASTFKHSSMCWMPDSQP